MTIAVADVGGTTIKLGVVADATLFARREVPTPTGSHAASAILQIVADHAANAVTRHGATRVSLVVPGIVDDRAGIGVWSENLGWRNEPFRERLTAATGLPATFGHDVSAAGLAEVRLGAARGAEQAAVIVIGTGLAAAIVADGRLIRAGGLAGELGHSIVQPGGRACVCGASGCLEATASAAAIAKAYTERTSTPVAGAVEVLERMHDGDHNAAVVWNDAIDALAIGIRQLQAITGCSTIVIGGGLSLAGDSLLKPLRKRVAAARTIQPVATIVAATLGGDAGMLGAAILAAEVTPHPGTTEEAQ